MKFKQLGKEKRRVLTKISINLCGIVFGMLVVGSFVSGRSFELIIMIYGIIFSMILLMLAIIFEPEEK